MYLVSQLTHFLDESGNLPADMTKEAAQLGGFLAMVVDAATTGEENGTLPCSKKKCKGNIIHEFSDDATVIFFHCTDCNKAGEISNWQGSRWDNTVR
ncbi:MAG: hypothetical protein KKA07_06005 [Bacteroidetes bacterium]|nr:hypothetical protein [Bacteroidota bacterium]MBU1718608.1 hypothetical protein [Bacteroidota bacterium]